MLTYAQNTQSNVSQVAYQMELTSSRYYPERVVSVGGKNKEKKNRRNKHCYNEPEKATSLP